MSPERKAYLAKRRKQHSLDKKHAQKLTEHFAWENIRYNPLDLPSLEKALGYKEKVPFLSTGHDWLDKPHRVAYDAIEEIRKLRALIVKELLD